MTGFILWVWCNRKWHKVGTYPTGVKAEKARDDYKKKNWPKRGNLYTRVRPAGEGTPLRPY